MEDVGGRTPRGVQSRCEHGKRGTGRVAALAAVGLIAGLLLALAGCGPLGTDPGSGVPVGSAGPEGSGAPRPEEQGQMWEETPVRAFPLDFSRTVGLKSGQLSCTVQGVQVLDNVSGLPRENFETWPTVETVDGEGQREILAYPDFIGADGQLLPGLYLVLADLTVTSQGAQSYTVRDRDAFGAPLGEFGDPCVFRADRLFWLKELREEWQTDCYLGYSSGRNQCPEHRLAYRLEDGESLDITLGFWVHDIGLDGLVSLEDLYLVAYENVITHLDLSGEVVGQP